MRTKHWSAAAGALVILAIAGTAYAVIGSDFLDSQGAYHGCVSTSGGPTKGTLRVVLPSENCKGSEVAITWNHTGPRGPQGLQGIQGIQGPTGPAASLNSLAASACSRSDGTASSVQVAVEWNNAITLSCGAPPPIICPGENYDVNGIRADGCEVSQPVSAHTRSTASPVVGNFTDCDSSTGTIAGVLPSDNRVHSAPIVENFDSSSGSAPMWFGAITHQDNSFCTFDPAFSVSLMNSAIPACYHVTLLNDIGDQLGVQTDATGHATSGAFSGSDTSPLYVKVAKTCGTAMNDAPSFRIDFHL